MYFQSRGLNLYKFNCWIMCMFPSHSLPGLMEFPSTEVQISISQGLKGIPAALGIPLFAYFPSFQYFPSQILAHSIFLNINVSPQFNETSGHPWGPSSLCPSLGIGFRQKAGAILG